MANSRSGAGNRENDPEISCPARTKKKKKTIKDSELDENNTGNISKNTAKIMMRIKGQSKF